MPPEDWVGWESAPITEPEPSADPDAGGPRESRAGAAVAQAYGKARRGWNRNPWWFASAGLVLLIVAVVAIALGGGDSDSSSSGSNSGAANSAAAGNEAASGKQAVSGNGASPKQSKPENTPATDTSPGELPLEDGDWRLESVRTAKSAYGDFSGTARIAYTGEKPEQSAIITVTVFKGDKQVATLQGQSDTVAPDHAATLQLPSSDDWVEGPYAYGFRADEVPAAP